MKFYGSAAEAGFILVTSLGLGSVVELQVRGFGGFICSILANGGGGFEAPCGVGSDRALRR